MIVDAKFSVKDKASFVPGELLRFHAAGRTRLGVVREIPQNGDVAILLFDGPDGHPITTSLHINGPFTSLGTNWVLEIVDGPETWVGNHQVGNVLGAIYSTTSGRFVSVEVPIVHIGLRNVNLESFQFEEEALPANAPSLHWRLWHSAEEMKTPGAKPLFDFVAGKG